MSAFFPGALNLPAYSDSELKECLKTRRWTTSDFDCGLIFEEEKCKDTCVWRSISSPVTSSFYEENVLKKSWWRRKPKVIKKFQLTYHAVTYVYLNKVHMAIDLANGALVPKGDNLMESLRASTFIVVSSTKQGLMNSLAIIFQF